MSTSEQNAWIGRVLGMQIPRSSTGPSGEFSAAAAAFREASEAVDDQIAALQTALRASEDDELRDIGEFGLNALTGNFRVPLMAALMGAQAGHAADIAKVSEAASAFSKHLEEDEKVEACDDNPFNVPMSIRATLLPVLKQLAASR